MVMNVRALAALMTAVFLAGCAGSSSRLLAPARPPINPAEVRIYQTPPPKFQEIARLDATSGPRFFHGTQQTDDEALLRLKVEAAKVGANGVLLTFVGDEPTGSLGIGVGGGGYASSHSAVSGGAAGSAPVVQTGAHGIAIYVFGQR